MLKLWDRFRLWGKEQIPYVNSNLFNLLVQVFYLVGVGAEITHSLCHRSLSNLKRTFRRETPSHKGKKVSFRNLLTVVHCSANRSRPRKCGRLLGNKKRMFLRKYRQWEGRINFLGWLIVFRQKKGHWKSKNSTSRWGLQEPGHEEQMLLFFILSSSEAAFCPSHYSYFTSVLSWCQ